MELDTNTSQVDFLVCVEQQSARNCFPGLKNLSVFSKNDCKQRWHGLSLLFKLSVHSKLRKVILWRKKSLVFKIFLHNMVATRKNNCCVTWIMNLSFLANNGNEIILRVSGIRWVWEFNKTNCTLCSISFGSVVFLTTYQINQPKIERKL